MWKCTVLPTNWPCVMSPRAVMSYRLQIAWQTWVTMTSVSYLRLYLSCVLPHPTTCRKLEQSVANFFTLNCSSEFIVLIMLVCGKLSGNNKPISKEKTNWMLPWVNTNDKNELFTLWKDKRLGAKPAGKNMYFNIKSRSDDGDIPGRKKLHHLYFPVGIQH